MSPPRRSSHADLDTEARRAKAIKIQRLLGLSPSGRRRRFLEIGTGSGVIASHFAEDPSLEIVSVDVVDERVVEDGYEFHLVDDALLPFDDASFDVVVSNHVIEHVGDRPSQRKHVTEIRRVMADGARAYLATPNRWAVVEPHFRLAFLSWLPPSYRSSYVRLTRRGAVYDCHPLSSSELDELLSGGLFTVKHLEADALQVMAETNQLSLPARWLRRIPRGTLQRLGSLSPTLIRLLDTDRSIVN